MLQAVVSGCSGLRSRTAPRLSLADVQVKEVKVFEAVFQVELRVLNRSNTCIEIEGLDCEISLGGKNFASSNSNTKKEIPPDETDILKVVAYSCHKSVFFPVWTSKTAQAPEKIEKVEYGIHGHLRLGSESIVSPAILLKSFGELSLGQISNRTDPQKGMNRTCKTGTSSVVPILWDRVLLYLNLKSAVPHLWQGKVMPTDEKTIACRKPS
jgi:LEA14-like dessication related protein